MRPRGSCRRENRTRISSPTVGDPLPFGHDQDFAALSALKLKLGVKWLLQRVWILEDWFHAWFTFDIARSCAN
jgi:hypothetical protein